MLDYSTRQCNGSASSSTRNSGGGKCWHPGGHCFNKRAEDTQFAMQQCNCMPASRIQSLASLAHCIRLLLCCARPHIMQGYDAWTYTTTKGQRPGGLYSVGDRAAANTGPVARGIRYNAGNDPYNAHSAEQYNSNPCCCSMFLASCVSDREQQFFQYNDMPLLLLLCMLQARCSLLATPTQAQ